MTKCNSARFRFELCDDIQQLQTVAPNKNMDNATSFTEGQSASIVRQYAEIKYEMKQIFQKFQGIERLLNNIAVNVNSTPHSILCYGEERSLLDQLPLQSVAEITNFNLIIAESSEKFNLLACIHIVAK